MIGKLFIFRHAETFDNQCGIFSGWRDTRLTSKGRRQAEKIAEQLRHCQIDYAFVSHLRRAQETLKIVLKEHPPNPVFIDDRLIERCYGSLQGKKKLKVKSENPNWYVQVHRGYDSIPPQGESLRMVEKRITSFLKQLRTWLEINPGNVAISSHGNAIRPIKRVYEHLSVEQMLQLEIPQDSAVVYELDCPNSSVKHSGERATKPTWDGVVLSRRIRAATDPQNLLRNYY